jgi:hypothetical protein
MLNQTKYQLLFFGMLVIIMRLLIRGTLAPPSLCDALAGLATAAILYFVLFLLVEEWKSAPPHRKQLYALVTGALLLLRGFSNLYAGTFSVFNSIGIIVGTMFLIFYWKNRRKNILG